MSTAVKMQDNSSLSSSSVVNGIDTDAVHTLIESVEANPTQGMTHWQVASTWQGGMHSRARVEIDIDEPLELGGGNAYANPQEYLLAGLNACMMVGYSALCALQGITLQKLEITTEGDIDLRGFFGLDPSVAPGYRELRTRVVIKGDGTEDQLRKIHELVLATSPNFYNVTRAVAVVPSLIIE
jgi:uncharacterized OsmC-like protein